MGVEGQNAILKILEEPPQYVNFILLCSSKSGFLPTVLSRAAVYNLGQTSTQDADVSRDEVVETAKKIALASAAMNDFEIVKAAGVFEKDKKLLYAVLPVVQEIYAAALRIKYYAEEENAEFGETAKELARKLSRNSLLALIESVDALMEAVRLNANHNLMVTAVCTKLRKAAVN